MSKTCCSGADAQVGRQTSDIKQQDTQRAPANVCGGCGCSSNGPCKCGQYLYRPQPAGNSVLGLCKCGCPGCKCNPPDVLAAADRLPWNPSLAYTCTPPATPSGPLQTLQKAIAEDLLLTRKDLGIQGVRFDWPNYTVEVFTPVLNTHPSHQQLIASALSSYGIVSSPAPTANLAKPNSKPVPSTSPPHLCLHLSPTPHTTTTTTTTRLAVHGMSCASCVAAIERQVSKQPGVQRVSVSLLGESAAVEHDPTAVQPAQLVSMIEDMGYEVKLKEAAKAASVGQGRLRVGGMTCAACTSAVERALKAVNGVQEAAVNLVTSQAFVLFQPEMCGMRDLLMAVESAGYEAALWKEDDARDSQPHRGEERRWRRLLVISALLSAPVVLFAMINMVPGVEDIEQETKVVNSLPYSWLAQLLVAGAVQLYVGASFYRAAYLGVIHRAANMSLLVALGTSAAFVYSIISVAMAASSPHYHGHVYFEASSLILTFVVAGKFMEAAARSRTSDVVRSLLSLAPKTAVLISVDKSTGDIISEQEVSLELIQEGDLLRVSPGAIVPTDGVVVAGSSAVNESMVTGEAMPVGKYVDSEVIGGTINTDGVLQMRATRVGQDTVLASIARLVSESQANKAPVQEVADLIASYFVPVVILLAAIDFSIWMPVGKFVVEHHHTLPNNVSPFLFAFLHGISVLVIACPCALGLATPTAVMVGTGIAARLGILIKGGVPLELAHRTQAVVFDKTGTLTMGVCKVTDAIMLDPTTSTTLPIGPDTSDTAEDASDSFGIASSSHDVIVGLRSWSRNDFLKMLGAVESGSEHPLGKAIVAYVREQGVEVQSGSVGEFTAVPGRGIRCRYGEDAVLVLVGNLQWMVDHKVWITPETLKRMHMLEDAGKTAVIVAAGGVPLGMLALSDEMKPEAPAVIAHLRARGMQCWMVTGDSRRVAHALSAQAGILPEHVVAEASPAQKVARIQQLRAELTRGRRPGVVAMVGDGINDSPALMEADVGIAIGAGTEIAMDAADVVLMKSHLGDVAVAFDVSRKTFRTIVWNFVWAYGYNTVAIPIAGGALFPVIKDLLPPWVAALAMALSSVSVVLSSLSLRWWYRPPTVA